LGAIALDPTGNAQGDDSFMSLATGARISRHQWTAALPMTDTDIARVHALGIAVEQPLILDRGFVVEWRPDHPIDDSEDDRDYYPRRNAPVDALPPICLIPSTTTKPPTCLLTPRPWCDCPAVDAVALDQGADNNNNNIY
jgi:hypothetical protein